MFKKRFHFTLLLCQVEREKRENTILDFEIKIFILPLLLSDECLQAKEQIKMQDLDFQIHVFPIYPHTNRHPFVSQEFCYLHPNPRLPHMVNKVKLHYCQ